MSKKTTETIDQTRRGLFLGNLQVPESKGKLVLTQQASSKIIDPLREELGQQSKILITASPDELKDMQTLDVQIAHYRVEVLKRGVSELELDTLIQRVVDKVLGTPLERRSFLQGMKHILLHRSLVRDVLAELVKKPFVQMPKHSNLVANIAHITSKEKIKHAGKNETTTITFLDGSILTIKHLSEIYTLNDDLVHINLQSSNAQKWIKQLGQPDRKIHSEKREGEIDAEDFQRVFNRLEQQTGEQNLNNTINNTYIRATDEIVAMCRKLNMRDGIINVIQNQSKFEKEVEKRLQVISHPTWKDPIRIEEQLGRKGWTQGQPNGTWGHDEELQAAWQQWKPGQPVPQCKVIESVNQHRKKHKQYTLSE